MLHEVPTTTSLLETAIIKKTVHPFTVIKEKRRFTCSYIYDWLQSADVSQLPVISIVAADVCPFHGTRVDAVAKVRNEGPPRKPSSGKAAVNSNDKAFRTRRRV